MGTFHMPSLGADMEAGTLVEWLVKPGAAVRHGDVIAVVETQKGAIEIEVFEDGIFETSLAAIGDRLPVGAPMAVIARPGGVALEAPAPPVSVTAVETTATAVPPPPIPQAVPVVPAEPEVAVRILVTPAARRLAEQSGVALAELHGSGPRGEIVLADVKARKGREDTSRPAEATATGQVMTGMRAAIAAAMARSKREIPHYYLSHTAELAKAETWLAAYNAGRDPASRMLPGALFVKAVAVAAKSYPEFNGHYLNGAFVAASAVHAGVAINIRGGGLVAPAIHDVDRMPLPELMERLKDLVARVRAGRFRGSELADPTITISSLGDRGVETLYGIIYPPQVAIVGFGTPVTKPVIEDGLIVPRRVVNLSLAGDHRVSDGHRGALFLGTIADLLQRPEAL